jgi:hypothetical protein
MRDQQCRFQRVFVWPDSCDDLLISEIDSVNALSICCVTTTDYHYALLFGLLRGARTYEQRAAVR